MKELFHLFFFLKTVTVKLIQQILFYLPIDKTYQKTFLCKAILKTKWCTNLKGFNKDLTLGKHCQFFHAY